MDDLGRWMRRVLDEVAPPVDPRGVVESVTRRGGRRWPTAVAAAAVVVLLVGGGYWLFAGEPTSGVADDTTTTSLESATTTTSPTEPVVLEILEPSSISCSSELPDFPCSNLIDGDPTTEWQAPNGGIGAVITIEFAEPVSVFALGFTNLPDDVRFRRNARIRGLAITAGGTHLPATAELADVNHETQSVGELDPAPIALVSTVRVALTSAYPAQSYGDLPPFAELALAELEIIGYPGALPEGDTTTATTITALPPQAPIGTWMRASLNLGDHDLQVRDLIWDGEAFYLLARVDTDGLVVWRSADGLDWREHSRMGDLDGGSAWTLVSIDGRLVAGGRTHQGATVWIEDRPNSWHRVVVAPSGIVGDLATFDGGLIAIGLSASSSGPDVTLPGVTSTVPQESNGLWTSSDGETWDAGADVGFLGDGWRASAIALGPRGMLAIVTPFGLDTPVAAGVVMSQDGLTWTTLDTIGLELAQVDAIAGGPTGYVAQGLGSPIMFSSDGVHWSSISIAPSAATEAGPFPVGLAFLGDVPVLVGAVNSQPGSLAFADRRPAVWAYTGGDDWVSLGSADWLFGETGELTEVVASSDRMVVVGHLGTGDWALFTFVVDEP